MYDELASVYDAIYRSRKDYVAEARLVTGLIRDRAPDAASLLDVACGTGEHLIHLRDEFEVTGVDISPQMIDVARTKLPGVELRVADMRELRLGQSYDAVICLFSAVGYLGASSELDAAMAAMAAHVHPGGVLVIEPWIFPEDWNEGRLGHDVSGSDEVRVARMVRSTARGRTAVMEMHYLVGDAAGVRHFTDRHEMTLFTRAEYEAAYAAAGCEVEFLPGGPTGRGLFVGRRQPAGGRRR
ncbi:MAG: class I SAM-dependent DNA methyltransferase [Micromonosporaceae bacterium]